MATTDDLLYQYGLMPDAEKVSFATLTNNLAIQRGKNETAALLKDGIAALELRRGCQALLANRRFQSIPES